MANRNWDSDDSWTGGWDSRSSQWKSGGRDGDWEDWKNWEEDPVWRPPSPEDPVDPKWHCGWKEGWKEGYTAGFNACWKHFDSSPRANTPGTGSGGAGPESSEVGKKRKKSQKKNRVKWIKYTKADQNKKPLFVCRTGTYAFTP